MNKKPRIAVLMGGPSSEHEVSLNTGRMILKTLDKNKYIIQPIIISKKTKWPISFEDLKNNFDLVFIAMHGEYGEDGTVQKILENYKIPYTGSDSQASSLGIDKIKSSRLFKKAGLNIPEETKKIPLVVKPVDCGSSKGITIVYSSKELPSALKLANKYSQQIIKQKFIKGRELTCGVLEINGKPRALPPTEIIPCSSNFFDFRAKYIKGASKEITPPKLPAKIIKEIQSCSLKAHKAIGARGFSRTDMILQNDQLYILEINTIPGMTKTSLLPQQAKAMGINFPKLLDIIIESVWKRKK